MLLPWAARITWCWPAEMLNRAKSCCLTLPDVRRSALEDCTCTRCLQHLRGKPSPARPLAAAEPVKSETIVVLDLRGIEHSSGPTGGYDKKMQAATSGQWSRRSGVIEHLRSHTTSVS
jgi:hypothetical protein